MNSLDWLRVMQVIPALVDAAEQMSPKGNGAQKLAAVVGGVTAALPVGEQSKAVQQINIVTTWANALVSLFKVVGFPHQKTVEPAHERESQEGAG